MKLCQTFTHGHIDVASAVLELPEGSGDFAPTVVVCLPLFVFVASPGSGTNFVPGTAVAHICDCPFSTSQLNIMLRCGLNEVATLQRTIQCTFSLLSDGQTPCILKFAIWMEPDPQTSFLSKNSTLQFTI